LQRRRVTAAVQLHRQVQRLSQDFAVGGRGLKPLHIVRQHAPVQIAEIMQRLDAVGNHLHVQRQIGH
jgi:hypothetical protein